MREETRGPSIRWAAATMTIAAGAVHVAQVRVHTDEDPLFGLFFVVVAALQLAGGAYIAWPLGPTALVRAAFVFGIFGSLAVIAIWVASRTFGLPFGAEPGEVGEVGLADAAANMFELFTALFLSLWLRQGRLADRGWLRWSIAGGVVAIALAVLWSALRALEILDPDPRLVLEPRFADLAAVSFLAVVALFFLHIALWPARPRVGLGAVTPVAMAVMLVLAEAPLVAFTIPPRGGQNLACLYAPIAEDSGLSHAEPPEPVEMEVGERRSVVILRLVACADAPVELREVTPIQPRGAGVVIESVSVDRTRPYLVDRVRDRPGPDAVPISGLELLPAAGRYPVTIQVRAVEEGRIDLPAWRVDFVYRGTEGIFGFASFTSFCVGHEACEEDR